MLTSAALVSVVAAISPLAVQLFRLPVPDVVLQILLGVVIGPQLLGWASADGPVRVLSLVGLSFLLFLAGLELEPKNLRGRSLRLSVLGFATSFVIALVVGGALGVVGLVKSPVLVAVILSATALGIVLPILDDAGRLDGPLGQLVVAGASLAEVVPVALLSLLFSEGSGGLGSQLTLFGTFLVLVAVAAVVLVGLERWTWLSRSLVALQSTTAEIRIRAAVALLMTFAAAASAFGLEAILGAFLAGATVSFLDRDEHESHQQFRPKLRAVGFGALIPFFFVATGMNLDIRSLVDEPSTTLRIPVFLAAFLLVRAVPALAYRPLLGSTRQAVAAGLFQATTLSIPVVGGQIGVQLQLITPENYVALVAAGLLSVIAFPQLGLLLARPRPPASAKRQTAGATPPQEGPA
ncbi:cation:proton antiporter [Luteipulveratus flavus]|uniref:Cation:proton antiporter n=1 Tax=Luteipulveratus flavus TaxID=3031728 RepID=A0ABT6CGU1_9MICO|nr:cation:proton antiporter [Luteipulveratus sp. YIM 133296]MDF8266531.1 cation:proton antiporter [Luteipulveratus sp. YIM 133296]